MTLADAQKAYDEARDNWQDALNTKIATEARCRELEQRLAEEQTRLSDARAITDQLDRVAFQALTVLAPLLKANEERTL